MRFSEPIIFVYIFDLLQTALVSNHDQALFPSVFARWIVAVRLFKRFRFVCSVIPLN